MSGELLMIPVGDASVASVRYRVLAHLPALVAAGLAPRVRFPRAAAFPAARRLARAIDLVGDALDARGARTVLVHRKTFPAPFASLLRGTSAPIVFDVDDAIDLPPPGGIPSPSELRRYAGNFRATAEAADLVVCGNREIASRLPHGRFEIVPTAIDTQRFRPGLFPAAGLPALGWVGHSDNFGYLDSIAESLREVTRRHRGTPLIVVADRKPDLPGVPLEFRRWSLAAEVECFSGMGVGLMPLLDTPWARAKCSFKAIQYMALGIPAVVSPVGMNRELVRDGENGFLPGDGAAWVRALDALLSDASLRARVAAAGRATVERDYSLDTVSARLVSILRDLPEGRSS
jgi:glycosyltransferase involved in cell wall biosynthesis